ncbi:MAG TPA: Stp1/IreP family PP2C-type Ser/Thr phosphatase [Clostridiales bacterium]|nr:Stp1/IreP family PP2C-type Ser/Thr phosphatase [Clostridiales bacterium]
MVIRSISDIGKYRKTNDDFSYYDEHKGLLLMADGMGGYAGGRIASSIAAQVFSDHFTTVEEETYRDDLTELFRLCNDEIVAAAKKDQRYREMGTTLTVLVAAKERYYIGHVGDSRAYLLRNGRLKCLTEDHNMVTKLLKTGQINEKEAKKHPGRSMLTRVIGRNPMCGIDFFDGDLKTDDMIFLCTDGISGYLLDKEISTLLRKNENIEDILHHVVKKVLDRGGEDNITAILAKNC